MRRIDELHLEFPFAGSRLLRDLLAGEGRKIGRRHVKTLMKRMGIEALYRRPRTTPSRRSHAYQAASPSPLRAETCITEISGLTSRALATARDKSKSTWGNRSILLRIMISAAE